MREVDKYRERPFTRLIQPKVTLDIYEQFGVFKDGRPAKKYIKTLEFNSEDEFEKLLLIGIWG